MQAPGGTSRIVPILVVSGGPEAVRKIVMAQLDNLVLYLCTAYPRTSRGDLTRARVAKLVYLVDVECVKVYGEPYTSIEWVRDNHGPFVWDVENAARVLVTAGLLTISVEQSVYGNDKHVYIAAPEASVPEVEDHMKEIIDDVIRETSRMGWSRFMERVYSTAPMEGTVKGNKLDLSKAKSPLQAARLPAVERARLAREEVCEIELNSDEEVDAYFEAVLQRKRA
jgi:hypothetical protein